MKKAFVAMPVSDNLDSRGEFRPERKAFFSAMVDVLVAQGIDVMSAGTNEQWGKVKLEPVQFTEYDVQSLMAVDLLVVVTNERLNRDMYLEIGIAVARGIPIILIAPASTKHTFMGLGLVELGLLLEFRFDAEQEAPEMLKKALNPQVAGMNPTVSVP